MCLSPLTCNSQRRFIHVVQIYLVVQSSNVSLFDSRLSTSANRSVPVASWLVVPPVSPSSHIHRQDSTLNIASIDSPLVPFKVFRTSHFTIASGLHTRSGRPHSVSDNTTPSLISNPNLHCPQDKRITMSSELLSVIPGFRKTFSVASLSPPTDLRNAVQPSASSLPAVVEYAPFAVHC